MVPKRRRHLSWILIGLPVVLLLVACIVIVQARSFLRSERFRIFLSEKVSKSIRANGAFQPLAWTDSSFYTDGYAATGNPGTSLESIEVEQLRADVNLQGLWQRKWQIEHVEIERLNLTPVTKRGNQSEERADEPSKEKPSSADTSKPAGVAIIPKATPRVELAETRTPASRSFLSGLLPNQVDIRRVSVANLHLDGKNLKSPFLLNGLKVEAKPDGKAWMLEGSGGQILFPKRPRIDISELAVRYVDKTYFISRSAFTFQGGGAASVTGQIGENSTEKTDLHVKTTSIPAASVIPKDWRAQLHGELSADLHAVSDGKDWIVSGPVTLTNGRLEALPVLDRVATFTRTQRFRQLNLETVHADVVIKNGKVKVTNLDAESSGLVRVTGSFIIEEGIMTGEFLVGLTPASLRWIPGSQGKIFTEERGGYLWSPMKVTGPIGNLSEDLSTRLAVAAGTELIETIQKDPSKLQDTLKDAAETLLDLFK